MNSRIFFIASIAYGDILKQTLEHSSILKTTSTSRFLECAFRENLKIYCLFSLDCDTNFDNHTFKNKQTASI